MRMSLRTHQLDEPGRLKVRLKVKAILPGRQLKNRLGFHTQVERDF